MKILSYFSYKGGSGRSSLAYNTIPFLIKKMNATPQHPIIVVDLDIDSAGLSFLLAENLLTSDDEVQCLTTNRLIDESNDIFSKYIALSRKSNGDFTTMDGYQMFMRIAERFGVNETSLSGSVLFVPVNPKENVSKFDDVPNSNIDNFIQVCKNYGAAAIIFDMPAGDQLVGRKAFEYSDKVITCFRITKQHRAGTLEFLKRRIPSVSAIEFIPVPNAVPQEEIFINGRKLNYDSIRKEIKDSIANTIDNSDCTYNLGMLEEDSFGVPEVKRFKYLEGILYTAKIDGQILNEDEEKALVAYEKVSDMIVKD